MFRRLTLAADAVATAATMLPVNAAPGKADLSFADVREGSATGLTPVYALTKTQGTRAGAAARSSPSRAPA